MNRPPPLTVDRGIRITIIQDLMPSIWDAHSPIKRCVAEALRLNQPRIILEESSGPSMSSSSATDHRVEYARHPAFEDTASGARA